MKLNKKGFVLAETLIVTVFVMTIFTVIYLNYYPIQGKYQQREYYDDIDSKLNTYWLKRFIQDDDIINQTHWNKIVTNIEATGGYELTCAQPPNEGNNCVDITPNYKEFFARYLEETGNTRIFITKYNLESTTHTNGQDSRLDATENVLGLNRIDSLIPQFKGDAKITYLSMMTSKDGTPYNNRRKIEARPMKICVEASTTKFYIQNGQFEHAVVVRKDDGSTVEEVANYTSSDYIHGCLYQAQHPASGKKYRCYINGTTKYDKDGNNNASNYDSQCPTLIANALPSGPVPTSYYEILKNKNEFIDKESQLVDYINLLPAFKFPSTKGANYRVIAEYKRKTAPGTNDPKTIINTYSNIEVKR